MTVHHSSPLSAGAATADAVAVVAQERWDPLGLLTRDADEDKVVRIPRVDWDTQMRRYGRRVIVSLIARGIAPERAKELAQDAWLRVIQAHRHGKLEQLKLPGVVVTQANFLALDDRRRSEKKYTFDALDSTRDDLHGDGHELEEQLAARHQLRKIQAVVSASHPNAKRVFELWYGGHGHSATEIADELGISVQRVRQITCELRQRIRRELGQGRTV